MPRKEDYLVSNLIDHSGAGAVVKRVQNLTYRYQPAYVEREMQAWEDMFRVGNMVNIF